MSPQRRHELTDEQWECIAPLLPPQKPAIGRPAKDHRTIINALLWLDKTGVPWRDLPERYGPWPTVATRFYRWTKQGIWQQILAELQTAANARGEIAWTIHFVDSSVVRAHQHAAGAKGGPDAAQRPRRGSVRAQSWWIQHQDPCAL
jgi:transposase